MDVLIREKTMTYAKTVMLLKIARFHRPFPILLLYLPCLWGIALCVSPEGDINILLSNALLFGIGASLMRGAGCIINDMCDASFDVQVERTKMRPLATKQLKSIEAILFFSFLLAASGGVWWCLNTPARLISLIGLAFLFIYPFTKRFFQFPQLILGFAFNIGTLVAVAQIKPELLFQPEPWILYAIGIFWTLYYDTIYALQDLKDDLVVGIHSTAVFFRHNIKLFLGSVYIAMNILMAFLGYYLKGDIWYYLTLILGLVYDLGVDLRRFNPENPKMVSRFFYHSLLMGGIIFFLILWP